ncbi:unnamed protein product [Meloidogyne enterolobii]|uniref:Uncharacterized protein n=2 Tax=Meloidogyne enterolobii TaxID=390850 RepID=A0ACB0ZIN5_MELEN
MYNEDYHPQPSTHQQPIYHQPPHNPYTHYPTIPSQGESSSMPNLQNNPNEIENVNQKYLLVTQEMINQRKEGQFFLGFSSIGIPDGFGDILPVF